MKRLKFEMWLHRPEVGGIMSRFTDGRGISTKSWWSSPMQSIDHVGPEYLKNPHRHPNVRNVKHATFIKRQYKVEMKRFKHDPDGWRKYEEVNHDSLQARTC